MAARSAHTQRFTCPSCGWAQTRLARLDGTGDAALARLQVAPLRCCKCLRRFYRFRTRRARIIFRAAVLLALVAIAVGVIFVIGRVA